ncbi:VWA domain-containing protein [Polynucleobacter sp. Adler-ghost]|uniref:VWA domain-containing protein n=1 Tax=Polynucleobacter sp. Adler-ghost TaxID=2770234 RepID=UPI001BFE7FBA|nr:VWA domain-containing protein [Polynucleobacter sp. Adler-ghost]QWE30079.1 VWA domain-containing protein [Polynucleobacter sp. Adler-ghost]
MNSDQVAWFDANIVAALVAINPRGLKGICLKGQFGPVREAWLSYFSDLCAPTARLIKAPANLVAEQLMGSLDIEATLNQGSLALSQGLLEKAQGNFLLLSMAERMDTQVLALISQALDSGNLQGSEFGVIALDESEAAGDRFSPRMMDRLAFEVYLDQFSLADMKQNLAIHADDIQSAKTLLPRVVCSIDFIEVLTKSALKIGIGSFRANQFAVETAKTLAALRGLQEVGQDEVVDAARLVYTFSKILHAPPEAEQPNQDDGENPKDEESHSQNPESNRPEEDVDNNQELEDQQSNPQPPSQEELEDIVVAAAKASVPKDFLAQSKQGARSTNAASHISGKSGESQNSFISGRPMSSRKGQPGGGRRLDVLKSIRAAIPWQRLRERQVSSQQYSSGKNKIDFRSEDLHIKQYLKRRGTVTIFLVDASGSSATQRLAEAKGALEQLLAQCYIRRDEVAMLSMRGSKAELILPPTRSLVRAKRNLATLPGGGGTPLAAGFRAANEMAIVLKRKGLTPIIVILSDGKANVNLKGVGGRSEAHSDALLAAKELRLKNHCVLFVDTSPQPEVLAQELSDMMAAQYLALPYNGSGKMISHAAIQLASVQ